MKQGPILLIAGFGDTSAMFTGLLETPLASSSDLLPMDLPGFGAPSLDGETTLESLAGAVADRARETGAEIVIAHSVASIIASLAAKRPDCRLSTIVSLEGNLTVEDAYFSGSAADFDDPLAFRAAFLDRLDRMAETGPIVARYRENVAKADPLALWQLGCDARRFSTAQVPGDVLAASADVLYLYNPENCSKSALAWLAQHPLRRIEIENASHWASVDQPRVLAGKIAEALDLRSR